ncbi:cupin domain-containing protein [Ralstonia solanacearum]|uniref:Cupin n=1 Tax=Ralstonia solanacearum K60 TaxID=1091042 RepID=A0AAP7ZK93_RALSL|nr:cupin domain-containing protein [Ralstonia solanacearum]OYQ11949.1 cupin [Ralstonia solanacearum K60]QOK82306.1 cupin domain-containing protein [Ralstonia solanacearum]RIJ88334.1 cupin domain-containing protein [Ralstonia solanacearum]CCF96069.1 putative cupin_2 family protein [Ralstonia solanacearum K60]
MHLPSFRILLAAAALQTATAAVAAPPADSTMSAPARQEIVLAGSQASIAGPTETFTGRARIDPLWSANKDINAAGAMVTFEPGARSAWHTHPYGQRLVVRSGVGLVQEWGKPVQVVRPGDAIWCPPGVKHWHGAAPKTAVTYLTVTGTVDGKNVDWMEKVTEDPYDGKQAR